MFQLIKYLSRVGHMASVAIFSGLIVFNYLFDLKSTHGDNPTYKRLLHVSSILLIVTGFANVFLIRGKRKLQPQHKGWLYLLEFKFLLGLTFTPLFNYPLKMFIEKQEELERFKTSYNFYLVCSLFFYSTFVKYYREEKCNYLRPPEETGKPQANEKVRYAKMTEEKSDERKER